MIILIPKLQLGLKCDMDKLIKRRSNSMDNDLLNKDIIEILGLEEQPEEKKTEMREKMSNAPKSYSS